MNTLLQALKDKLPVRATVFGAYGSARVRRSLVACVGEIDLRGTVFGIDPAQVGAFK